MFDTSAMMISTFTHAWHCEVLENILASVFDDLPIFLVMFNDQLIPRFSAMHSVLIKIVP